MSRGTDACYCCRRRREGDSGRAQMAVARRTKLEAALLSGELPRLAQRLGRTQEAVHTSGYFYIVRASRERGRRCGCLENGSGAARLHDFFLLPNNLIGGSFGSAAFHRERQRQRKRERCTHRWGSYWGGEKGDCTTHFTLCEHTVGEFPPLALPDGEHEVPYFRLKSSCRAPSLVHVISLIRFLCPSSRDRGPSALLLSAVR